MDENELLNQKLEEYADNDDDGGDREYDDGLTPPTSNNVRLTKGKNHDTDLDFSQWQVASNGRFRPASRTIPHLHAGVYKIQHDDYGFYLEHQQVICDEIVELPETANIKVLDSMKTFWTRKDRYRQYGLIYKRGILLWGPPGSGKSVTLQLLMRELIAHDGIVLIMTNPEYMVMMLGKIRGMEPGRPLIVVMEDIDEIIERYSEHSILSLLDGENQVDNIVFVSTTNYPERLGARIVNRPSRFDERIMVGMPSLVARKAYLQQSKFPLDEATIETWAVETDGFSIAHLRELVAAVFCLDQPFDGVVKRLKLMSERPKSEDGFAKKGLGF